MGTYRNISLTFWSDAKVNDDFTAWDKYVYLYLLTNPKTNICGCYEISQKQMVLDTGLSDETVHDALRRLQDVHHVIALCDRTREVLIYKWGKYNWTRSEKVAAAVKSVAMYIKCDEFRDYVLDAVDKRMTIEIPKEERSKEENRKQKTDTESRNRKQNQKTESVSDTDVSIGYGYPMDRVSESETPDGGVCVSKEDFKAFWEAYPRQINEKAARAAFQKVTVPLETLLSAIEAQKQTDTWKRGVIPSPANWLKDERWEDGITPTEKKSEAKPRRKGALPF